MDKFLASLSKFFITRRVSVFGVSLGLGVIVIMAALMRRRRSRFNKYNKLCNGGVSVSNNDTGSNKILNGPRRRTYSPLSSGRCTKPRAPVSHASSLTNISDISNAATITEVEGLPVTPHDLCDIGMETLQQAIECWEDAMSQLSHSDSENLQSSDQTDLSDQLQHLLEMSYHIQDEYERRCIRHADHLAIDSAMAAIATMDHAYESRRTKSSAGDTDITSDRDSFVSAIDLADLSDLDSHRELFHHLGLYEAGLLEIRHGHIPCRTLRTVMTGCLSDTEFLAKLHGIRFATELLLQDGDKRRYFISATRTMLERLLVKCNKDTEEFVLAYDAMMVYLQEPSNHKQMAEELRARGVKCISFYDVALDFLMMDAFDDLDNPPSSVTAVAHNRWLSNGFKETALSTAIWSVLKAKRKLLREPNGFISHFYQISEHISPILAWGLLGPDSSIKPLCTQFKELVQGFIRDVFSFEKVRYTTLDHLAEDILKCARETDRAAALYMT